MRNQLCSTRLILIAITSLAAACGGLDPGPAQLGASQQAISRIPVPPVILKPLQPVDQSFLPFDHWGTHFTAAEEWNTADTPVLFGHVNADSKADFVGFGNAGVWVGLSAGTHFSSVQYVLADFGTQQSWHSDRHVRLLGDINGDGLDDIVAFGDAGVYTALSNGSGFLPSRFVIPDLGYNQGWRVDQHTRLLADVNGDGRQDIVAFGNAGVYIALADGTGRFGALHFAVANFGNNQGWSNAYLRTTADVNGDGRADLVAFSGSGVWTALSNGSGFDSPRQVLYSTNSLFTFAVQRTMADVNSDGRKDLVWLALDGLHAALSQGDGTFSAPTLAYPASGLVGATVADLNADGYADLLLYDSAHGEWQHVLGGPWGYGARVAVKLGGEYGWQLADVDGDGMVDLVVRTTDDTEVARSSRTAPVPVPAAPNGLYLSDVGNNSVTVNWLDNSTNEAGFEVQPIENHQDYFESVDAPANATDSGVGDLDSDSDYCFQVRAFNDVGASDWSAQACTHTASDPPPSFPQTLSLWMKEDSPPYTGTVTYTANWNNPGKTITDFRSSYNNGDGILFLKPNYGPAACYPGSPDVIALPSEGSLTSAQVQAVSWPGAYGSTDFHGCLARAQESSNVLPSLVFNVDYQ